MTHDERLANDCRQAQELVPFHVTWIDFPVIKANALESPIDRVYRTIVNRQRALLRRICNGTR